MARRDLSASVTNRRPRFSTSHGLGQLNTEQVGISRSPPDISRHTGPMRLTALMLADHAEAVRGKLYMTGGAWDTIHAKQFPVLHPHVSVVLVLEVGWEDLDRSVPVEVKLMDADGRPLLKQAVGGQARASKRPGVSPGDTTPLILVFNLLG